MSGLVEAAVGIAGKGTKCTVMCKDVPIYEVVLHGDEVSDITVLKQYTDFIITAEHITKTLKNRLSVFNRLGLDDALSSIGITTKLSLLRLTHGVSLFDCLWLKFEGESISWGDVNPYTKEQVFDVGWFIEKSNPIYKIVLPNYSTDGTFPKCWITSGGTHKLVKAGTRGAYNAGLEPFCEILFTQIADAICYNNYVRYNLKIIRYPDAKEYNLPGIIRDNTSITDGRPATVCDSFTSETRSLVTAKELGLSSYEECLLFAERYTNNPKDLALMLLCDCIGLNEDRHFGNIGFIYNPDTFKIEAVAPMYDNNLSLLCYWEDRTDLEEYLGEQRAKDGRTFRQLASMLLKQYPDLKRNLTYVLHPIRIELKSDWLCKERLDILNKVVNDNVIQYLKDSYQ